MWILTFAEVGAHGCHALMSGWGVAQIGTRQREQVCRGHGATRPSSADRSWKRNPPTLQLFQWLAREAIVGVRLLTTDYLGVTEKAALEILLTRVCEYGERFEVWVYHRHEAAPGRAKTPIEQSSLVALRT